MKQNAAMEMKTVNPVGSIPVARKTSVWIKIKKQQVLLWMSVPIMLYIFLFSFVPLWGWLMAFKDYHIGTNLWKAEWVGFKYFKMLLGHDDFRLALRNNVVMNAMGLSAGMFCSISLAMVLSELKSKWFVRVVQTMTYLPYFVSMVVVANIFYMLLSPDSGLLNQIMLKFGWIDEPIFFFGKGNWFWGLNTIVVTWKSFGWGAILYLAAISGIDPSLYDAADVDGASRWQRIKYIIFPSIVPTIVLLLIMNIGHLVNSGFESQLLLGNALNIDHSEVLTILSLRLGINQGNFSFGTAVGVFNSIVSIAMVLIANQIARRYQTNLF